MLISQLRRTHKDFDLARLEKHRDLFNGGDDFSKNITRYLLKNDREPASVYQRRCQIGADEYINYSGPIGNHFASWLFTSQLTYAWDSDSPDEFYEQFRTDCDGEGLSFDHFLRHRFIEAVIYKSAFWRIEFPEKPPEDARPRVLAEWKASGLGRATLEAVPATSVVNWRKDKVGYVWLTQYEYDCALEDPADDEETVTETWTVWRRDGEHRRYQLKYPKKQKPSDNVVAPEIDIPEKQGQLKGIPIVELSLPDELWLMNLIAAPQLSNFRKRAGLSWAIDRTCYAMPYFNIKNKRKPPTMGVGYYLLLGENEKAGYLAPPDTPFSVVKEFVAELKDEIHRVATQMARGVDNNAAALGRSGVSKDADNLATEIVLAGYGMHIRKAAENTMNRVAEGRGDDDSCVVAGMETYHVTDADTFTKLAIASQGLNIPSVTHHKLIAKRHSVLTLPEATEQEREQINKEIDAGITPESLAAAKQPPMPPAPGTPGAPPVPGAKPPTGNQPPAPTT